MLHHWYKVSIRFQEVVENDVLKTVTEEYLFFAISYSDAEVQATKAFEARNNGFEIHKVTKVLIHEIFIGDLLGSTWFAATVQYIVFDEKSKTEKRTSVKFLINSDSLKKAHEELEVKLGTIEDYEITEIKKTKILDVFPEGSQPEDADSNAE